MLARLLWVRGWLNVGVLDLDQLYPRSAGYDQAWVRSLDMGPNPLQQLEALLPSLALRPGQRVLDLGCGRGATSIFLARECGVDVVAVDLWIDEATVQAEVERFELASRVHPVQADARRLPFEDATFDAIVSVDAWEYFGTDIRLLPEVVRTLKFGGRIAVSTPALVADPYDVDPPGGVTALVGPEAAAWHSPAWWRRHWKLSAVVDDIYATMHPHGHALWLAWSESLPNDASTTQMLRSVFPEELGIALIAARRKS